MSTTPNWIIVSGEGLESYTRIHLIREHCLKRKRDSASGPNTFVVVQNIIDTMEDKYFRETGQNPKENIEFQVLFNDFSNNNCNTLFQSLHPERKYDCAVVPGSVYERVLPKQSFHIRVINYAFHFTSKNPKEITDSESPLWNKDMHCTWFNSLVKKAYLDQYSININNLLMLELKSS